MIPLCSHTGTPRHFHSSITSGSACLISMRTRASISPRQSPSSLILPSISAEGEPAAFASCFAAAGFAADFLTAFLTTFAVEIFFAGLFILLVHPFEEIFETVEPALPKAGHPAGPVDQRRQRAELRAVMRLAAFRTVAHQPGLLENAEMFRDRRLRNSGLRRQGPDRLLAVAAQPLQD